VVEVICITLYSIVFYRYYTKRRLHKSMDMRDKARSDLYLAQLRTQSAPNTPGFGPKSPAFSQYALSPRFPPAAYRNLDDIEESPFTPGHKFTEATSAFAQENKKEPAFKLQAPPSKARTATPKLGGGSFTPRSTTPPSQSFAESAPAASSEPTYDAVPIPGAYADQAVKSPPAHQTSFGQAR
jgi:hypothetical protein